MNCIRGDGKINRQDGRREWDANDGGRELSKDGLQGKEQKIKGKDLSSLSLMHFISGLTIVALGV